MNTRDMTLSALIAAIIFISAQLSFPLPFSPVPITLQVFAVLLFPLILPLRVALTGISVYLFLGAVGIPVFAQFGGGIGVLLGPKGGYLFGFLLATIACGLLARQWSKATLARNVIIGAVGLTIIYALGLVGLMNALSVPLSKALTMGLFPFLPGDLVKLAAASVVALSVGKRVVHQFG
ncbi:biotin transporter BioY [Heliobacterium gestii]|uniref:Biotin transporter n=1 Tax=Heliomicrobium gestii TaxID=2699 RepID=A0A845LGV0_HELGE|nr:biotin transporter BioY [Heliomicrobium gestii]MBM7868499.1 biotin transport system substrate-specific component [Heliomicrobium gestii]MZP44654.1 biotin transporter BioY [Heliomicrobium gestii]